MGEPNVPAEWAALMEPRGIHSANALAARGGGATSTITRLFQGGASTEPTLEAIADALHVSITRVRKVAGHRAGLDEPFVLPPEANRLDQRQRDAVVELVRLLAETGDNVVQMSAGSGKTATVIDSHRAASRKRGGGRDKGDDPNA